MSKIMLSNTVRVKQKNGINFLFDHNNRLIRNKPWLGELFSFLYDRIMEKSVFPKKFSASVEEHYKILNEIFAGVTGKMIIELATGTGDAVRFLRKENTYAGVDISSGLLRIAKKRFDNFGYNDFELYNADACKTPFTDNIFDVAVCNLSLNFIHDVDGFITELQRILKTNGIFYCSVPVPERKQSKAVIHGNLYEIDELKALFGKKNFTFETFPYRNGALLYFKAILNNRGF
ncbi:MAG: class I SAM-dependent methyltransferase [Sphingobacteriia bacterium]|nr:class I SAM-dependent methyltransferase [Sphingobacteriia bacterium]